MEHEVPHYDDLMSNEVCREELEHCKARHPKLNDALVRLQATLQQALCRELQVTPDKRALQIAVFGLAHQAADDFYDVVLLGTPGYGIGAQKLIRPLYERVVSALYLIEHPDEVQDFNDYADIDAWHVITNAKRVGVDPASIMGQERYDQVEKAYKDAEARFTRSGSKSARPSWAQKDLAQRAALSVGPTGTRSGRRIGRDLSGFLGEERPTRVGATQGRMRRNPLSPQAPRSSSVEYRLAHLLDLSHGTSHHERVGEYLSGIPGGLKANGLRSHPGPDQLCLAIARARRKRSDGREAHDLLGSLAHAQRAHHRLRARDGKQSD